MLATILWGALLVFPALTHAKDAPEGAIGRIEGYDVSVEGGVPAGNGTDTNAPAVFVSNGSIVTVHSGAARMSLTSGGHVDICGPAKFTLLAASGAITLALNFGRMRVQLPTNTQLRIFTPTIIGTPLDVDSVPRDVTFGLTVDDSLCVLATNGAIQLEHQFTGEKLIVPQDGEFFLSSGKLLPVAGTPGTCECSAMQPRTVLSQPPEYATTTAPPVVPAPLVAPAPVAPSIPSASIAALPTAEAPAEFSVPVHSEDVHPVVPPEKTPPASPAPAIAPPTYTAVMPPLMFNAAAPAAPDDPGSDMVLLIRQAHVDPDYKFSGQVQSPGFAEAMQNALGVTPSPSSQATIKNPAVPQKKQGFWSKVKRIFGGS